MEIRISIRTAKPLTGTAATGGEEPLTFAGWVELLHVLSTLLEEEPIPTQEEDTR